MPPASTAAGFGRVLSHNRSAPGLGWAGRTDSELLKLADAEFDLFITLDSNLVFQQNLGATSLTNADPGTVITIG